MDFSNLAREFLDGLEGVLLAQNNHHRGVSEDPVDNRQRAAAHHHYPSIISLNSLLDTTQETTNSDSEDELPRRVPPGTSARNRTRQRTSATTPWFGPHHAPGLQQPTVEHLPPGSPIPPKHLARSNSLQINPSERVVTIKQPPPPTTTTPPTVRESSSSPHNPVVVSPPTRPRPPRQTRTGQGSTKHRPLVHSESQGSSRSRKEPTTGGRTNLMCHLTELSLDVCLGGDTQTGAAVAVAAAVVDPDVEKRAPVAADDDTVPDKEKESRELHDNKHSDKKHLSWFGHGKFWTCFAILFAWMGVVLAILSRQSTEFVHLVTGFDVSPQFEPLHNFGMLYVELCFNATMMHDSSCQILRLSTDDVDDNLFNFSRALLGLATALGGVLALMISTSIFWESINLKPIGIGFLVTYLFQSFSLLFFDTDLCNDYTCRMGPGCILCILASLCWLAACVGTAKMDVFKLRAIRARRRNARRLAKADHKARKLLQRRQKDLERITSISTASSSRDEEEPSPEPAKGRVGVSMVW